MPEIEIDRWINFDEFMKVVEEHGGQIEFNVQGKIRYSPVDRFNAV